MLRIAGIGFVAGEGLARSHSAFTALLGKAAPSGSELGGDSLGLSSPLLPPVGCATGSGVKPRGAPTFQRTSETGGFHFQPSE